ncbi:MAG: hypothetical protein RIC18_12845 [Hoeflea sp.]|uniref:hypothetical protein n=1 Tax=Hoeflea sp. TaxID=1940281 RepID=UPI0032EC2230
MTNSSIEAEAESLRSYHRGSDVRYGANCPGIIELTFMNRTYYIALTGSIVNISKSGCLFSSDRTPWATMPIDQTQESLQRLIDEKCHVYMPWANTHRTGTVRRIRSFIVGVEFDKKLKESTASLIARLEPGGPRVFSPANREKYNHIIPFGNKWPNRQIGRIHSL